MNPLLEAWDTPFGLPPFDRIRAGHVVPALETAMAEHLAEVAAIGGDPRPPDFARVIEALERAGGTLDRVWHVFANLASSLGGAEIEAVEREMAPVLARHALRVRLDPALFARIDALWRRAGELALDPDQARLLERTHRAFVREGAALEAPARARLSAIAERLAVLQTRFRQNLLHDETAWVLTLDEAGLAGLGSAARDGTARVAASRGIDGWALTLSRPQVEAFLSSASRRDLRETVWRVWAARGGHAGARDNRVLIPEILALRQERARLLGAADFATFRLSETMAGSPDAVHALLRRVWEPASRRARAEEVLLAGLARADGINGALEPWDWRFYAERARLEAFEVDEAALRDHLPLESVRAAAFEVAGRLFGLRFRPVEGVALYHPDVRAFEVSDAVGAHVGVFLTDDLARPGKRSGAWMSVLRAQEEGVRPIVVNTMNFAPGEPVLLGFEDARTLFHEFGHALHGLLSAVRYRSQAGTRVLRDFVEFPSQVMEHWLAEPAVLRAHARHWRTGEAIGEAAVSRLLASRASGQGFRTAEYVGSAMIDLALHQHPSPEGLDVEGFERSFLAEIGMPAAIGLRARPAHFSHLFDGDGYAAGYYAYLWSEVLDADGFAAFTEAGDVFDPALAARLRAVFGAGDTREPAALYRSFRGRDPDPDALLRGRDLMPA